MKEKNITPIAIRAKDLPDFMPMSTRQAYNIFKALERELERKDSKLDAKALVKVGKLKYFTVKAIYWFLQNKDKLEDETARSRVIKFNSNDYNNIL